MRCADPLTRRCSLRLAVDVLLPGCKQGPKPAGEVGSLSDQVVALPKVRSQIEQQRSAAVQEQLPLARADGLLTLHAPKESSFDLWGSSFQHGKQIDSVEPSLRRYPRSCGGQDRC